MYTRACIRYECRCTHPCIHTHTHAEIQVNQSQHSQTEKTTAIKTVSDGAVMQCVLLSCRPSYLVCRLLMRHSMSKWPAEYCSITSFTSYGRSVSLNFFLATWNFIILHKQQGNVSTSHKGELSYSQYKWPAVTVTKSYYAGWNENTLFLHTYSANTSTIT